MIEAERPRERGAVLVEAAFVIPILLLFIFGTIDFGWTFNQYTAVRQGVREGAREAAVNTLPQPSSGTWASAGCSLAANNLPADAANADFTDMMCYTKNRIGLGMGTAVRVSIAWDSPGTGWVYSADPTKVASLVVCAQYRVNSITGVYGPIMNGHVLTAKTEIRIEQAPASNIPTSTATSPIQESAWSSWPASCQAP
jgi:Flp pilus assembly protein TadG